MLDSREETHFQSWSSFLSFTRLLRQGICPLILNIAVHFEFERNGVVSERNNKIFSVSDY